MELMNGDWMLIMNDMRTAHCENLQPVASASTKEELEAFFVNEKVETYQDKNEQRRNPSPSNHGGNETWGKSFRKDGPLEWMNPGSVEFIQYFSQPPPDVPSVEELVG